MAKKCLVLAAAILMFACAGFCAGEAVVKPQAQKAAASADAASCETPKPSKSLWQYIMDADKWIKDNLW